jgi:Low-density lipoprotein receptor repeat class B
VAVNGSHLYWGDADQGAISEANLDGSSRHIIVTGQDVPQMVAVTPAGP